MFSIRISATVLTALACIGATAVAAPYGDITFLVVSDLHYGFTGLAGAETATIDSMNAIAGRTYPAAIGGTVDVPRGVMVNGDILDNGNDSPSWLAFTNDYGLKGEKRLHFPVYEGYGNHDWNTVVRNGIKSRNLQRVGFVNKSANGYHYSWDWDNVHVVQLNLYAGDGPGLNGQGSPDSALSFLKADLAKNVGTSGRPVVLGQHYGWDTFSANWWSDSEKAAMYAVVKNYNIIAIFHGHCHCVGTAVWNGIDTYDDGSVKDNSDGMGNFFVVHIAGNRMNIVNHEKAGWNESWTKTINPGPTTAVAGRFVVRAPAIGRHMTEMVADLQGRLVGPSLTKTTGMHGRMMATGVYLIKDGTGRTGLIARAGTL
jgi:cytolysin (calcineurin-like family phosphatase)